MDLKEKWLSLVGREAEGEVTIKYKAGIEGSGCCEYCYSEQVVLKFILSDGRESITVYPEELGMEETY